MSVAGGGLLVVLAPAAGWAQAAGRTLPIERPVVAVERAVEPFDGRFVERDGEAVTVVLDADVLFELDQDSLTPQAGATLVELAHQLDEQLAGDVVEIVGHADALGDDARNLDLSRRRAGSVRDLLASEVTVPVRFEVSGRGEAEPVAPNETPDGADDPAGRRRNRRVEISFTATPEETGSP
jgi:outer membrane protein OmpA-like peptidoglycan-associated protein